MAIDVAVGSASFPFALVYPWSSGFGSKYSDPASAPAAAGRVAFTPDGTKLFVADGASPNIDGYPWTLGTGFGTLPTGLGNGVDATNSDAAVAHSTTPFVSAYPINTGAFGSKYSDPGTLPAGNAFAIKFSPSAAHVIIGGNTTPFVWAYPWSAGFGTKVSDPATLPAGSLTDDALGWSPSGNDVAMAHDSSPFITVWAWSAGFGSKYSNPGTLPTGNGRAVGWSPDGAYLIVGHTTTPFVSAYPWSSGFGTKVSDPGTLPAGAGRGKICFPNSGADVVMAHGTSPFVAAYPWSAGFGSKYSNPGTLPAATGLSASFGATAAVASALHRLLTLGVG
jgi:hypothetical protein